MKHNLTKNPTVYIHQVIHGENIPLYVKNSNTDLVCSIYTKALYAPSVVIQSNSENILPNWNYSIFDTYGDAESYVYKDLITSWKHERGFLEVNTSSWCDVDITPGQNEPFLKEHNSNKLKILHDLLATAHIISPDELLDRINLKSVFM